MERSTYQMAYECINCNTVTIVEINYRSAAPVSLVLICDYCGCSLFRHPRKPTEQEVLDRVTDKTKI